MAEATLKEVRFNSFKTFRGAILPLDDVTVLTGRNSAGKSNAFDGIEVLARLSGGEDLTDALDGRRREGGPVRGGSKGCAPHGEDEFSLGCSVDFNDETLDYDVTIRTEPELRVIKEELIGPAPMLSSGRVERRSLIATRPVSEDEAGIHAEIHNGRRGGNPTTVFRDNRLVLTQVPLRLQGDTAAEAAVTAAAEAVVAALRGAFHLDPVPVLMRDYVSVRDNDLRRSGENISAVMAKLRSTDVATFDSLVDLLRQVSDLPISDIDLTPSSLGDVMLTLQESNGATPAREMSDGLLRLLAIAAALLTAGRGLDIDSGLAGGTVQPGVLLVFEELENGLHPSQARRVLDLILKSLSHESTKAIFTTHSPALLNAMTGTLNESIVVCFRDAQSGRSQLTRMPNLPGYAEALALGALGDVVTQGHLVKPESPTKDYDEFARLIGLD